MQDLAPELVLILEGAFDGPIKMPSADHDRVEIFAFYVIGVHISNANTPSGRAYVICRSHPNNFASVTNVLGQIELIAIRLQIFKLYRFENVAKAWSAPMTNRRLITGHRKLRTVFC